VADQSQHEKAFPPQHQDQQPGIQAEMQPQPISISADYRGSHKLHGKAALISGGDSGIGRAVALHFAREGASVAFIYCGQQNRALSRGSVNRGDGSDDDMEKRDADETVSLIEAEQSDALALRGDVSDKSFCEYAVAKRSRNSVRWIFSSITPVSSTSSGALKTFRRSSCRKLLRRISSVIFI